MRRSVLPLAAICVLSATPVRAGWEWLHPRTTNNLLTGLATSGRDTLFAAGVEGTVLRSYDAGRNWTLLPTPFMSDLHSIVFPLSGAVGYAGGNSGEVYRTEDRCETWTRLQLVNRSLEIPDLCFPGGPDSGYAVGLEPDTIYLTTDGGLTWQHLPLPGSYFCTQASFPQDIRTGYVVGGGGRILKTTDAGTSWQVLNSGTLENLHAVCFPRNPDSGLVAGGDTFILRTVDGGLTWQRCPTPTHVGQFTAITCVPGTDIVYAAGYHRLVFRSTDFGQTWAWVGQTALKISAVAFPAGADTGYAVGEQGRVYQTTDAGATWRNLTPVAHTAHLLTVVFPTGPDTGYAAGSEGTILKTTDAGETWIRLDLQTSSTVSGLAFPAGRDTGYACDAWGNLYLTWDGENWLATGFAPYGLTDICFPDGTQVGYACGLDGSFAKTTDGGINWTYPPGPTSDNMSALSFPPGQSDTGWVSTWNGMVYKTTDGAVTWTGMSTGLGNGQEAISFPLDTRTGYVVGSGIARTTDGGATWVRQLPAPGYSLYTVQFPFGNDTGYVSGGAVLMTTDGGSTWTPQATRCRNELPGIWFCGRTGIGYGVGPYGTILKASEGGHWLEEKPPVGPRSSCGPTTLVRGVLRVANGIQRAEYRAQLLDISGRKVMDLQPGENNVSHLAPGVYFISPAAGSGRGAPGIRRVVVTR